MLSLFAALVCGFVVCLTASQIWPDEGLFNCLMSMVSGLGDEAGFFDVDLILTPAPPFGRGNTFSGCTFGVVSGAFLAVSTNASLTNIVSNADVIPAAIIGGTAIAQASPITFTNISGIDQTINGVAMYDPSSTYPSGTDLLLNVQELPTGPVNIPPGGTLVVDVILGDASLITS